MAELMLVNPKRRKRSGGRRKRRKMTALQAQYFGGGRKRRRHKRRRSVPTVLTENSGRRRRSHRRTSRRLRRMGIKRYRRNPGMGGMNINSFVRGTMMPAGVGAMGALGVDLAIGYGAPYLPSALTSGIGLIATRLAGAVGIGMLAAKTMGRNFGEQATAGAVTVILYSTIKSYVQMNMPSLPLSGMGWISPALQTGQMSGMGVYVGSDHAYGMSGIGGNMGMYVGERESDYIRSY